MSPTQNVFSGPDALSKFLAPQSAGPTPLVELPGALNPLIDERVRVFAKVALLSPLFNSKQLAAWSLLTHAKAAGELEGVHTLVENSSGNMALALAVLAPQFGVSRVVAVVPRDIPPGKLDLLRLFGIDLEFSSTAPGAASGVAHARELGARDGWYNLGQYENSANPEAYERYLAPELWMQTDKKLTVFAAGLGTTGTLIGSGTYFKQEAEGVSMVGVVPARDNVPGVRSERRLKEVAHSWQDALDHRVEVEARDAFKASLMLCRVGILAGPSSGMALAGLTQFLQEQQDAGALDSLRNVDGEVVAVFVCPDSAHLYLDKYPTHLDPEDYA